jgi:hypothetical protein
VAVPLLMVALAVALVVLLAVGTPLLTVVAPLPAGEVSVIAHWSILERLIQHLLLGWVHRYLLLLRASPCCYCQVSAGRHSHLHAVGEGNLKAGSDCRCLKAWQVGCDGARVHVPSVWPYAYRCQNIKLQA